MNRREFLAGGAAAASAIAIDRSAAGEPAAQPDADSKRPVGLDVNRCRFGVNYTPSQNWWFCWNDWNDWNTQPIQRDLDAIAALGADHLRIMLIWPFFQPNPKWVSPAHLDRLNQLLQMMRQRNLDALVTVFTGQLSGWYFLPSFNRLSNGFYNTPLMRDAQDLFVRELARTMARHDNIIGFDFGNELNTCWKASTGEGDAWMSRMFSLMDGALHSSLNVNGVDHHPWFEEDTFSPQELAAARFPVMHCYPWWTGALKYGGAMDPPSIGLLAGMAALIRSYAGTNQKPVWAGEFNTCIEELSEKDQAAWLEKAVTVAIDEGVNWFTYWDSHDVDRKFQFNPLEYSLGLLTNNGQVKEQGRVFKQLADAYRGKLVRYPSGSPPSPPQERTMDGTWAWINNWLGWKPKGA
jgi:endo-1,4-beta-mannosidase